VLGTGGRAGFFPKKSYHFNSSFFGLFGILKALALVKFPLYFSLIASACFAMFFSYQHYLPRSSDCFFAVVFPPHF